MNTTGPLAAEAGALPQPITVPCDAADLKDLLAAEWLVSNKIGAYASSTVIGCNTRRYHGLLVASTHPPVGRLTALSQVAEQVTVGEGSFDLATIEFPDALAPRGLDRLAEFRNDVAATFVYRIGPLELIKQVVLAESANAVALRYTLNGADGSLRLLPLVALRDFHHLRKAANPHQMTFEAVEDGAVVHDRMRPVPPLYLLAREGRFEPHPQWWYRFHYRTDLARGQEASEDLYTPGAFGLALADGRPAQLTASLGEPHLLDFDDACRRRRGRAEQIVGALGGEADETTRRLAAAGEAFIVRRKFLGAADSCTILAGYHWFADWGRDTFIALPGLLLATGQFGLARDVFRTFARHVSEGMIPNRFDDYTDAAHYNSIDASLWFVVAAERYVRATGDTDFWRDELMPAAEAVLRAYQDGTRFDIRADADGLLTGGSRQTQLTWMDVAFGEEAVTPRHGKAVEVNALWHSAHRILARRSRGLDEPLADTCDARASMIAAAFERVFWNEQAGCLFDCVTGDQRDGAIRPNQIFAVSLPYSPLPLARQRSVLRVVQEKLLTPMGLRTLAPDDARYRRKYGGSWESRDRAYHQGTVWAWLIGAFVEAYLKVEGAKPFAVAQARQWLAGFDDHLREAGVGFVSEIFDGQPPHTPRGCIAQAWSVGELLRAKRIVDGAFGVTDQ